MKQNKSFWENKDGSWTFASLLGRALCFGIRDQFIAFPEAYYILSSLNGVERFSDYLNLSENYLMSGHREKAIESVDTTRHGWRAQKGMVAWQCGDIDRAKRFFEESSQHENTQEDSEGDAGWEGLLKLAFVKGEHTQCCDIFFNISPPYEFYEKREKNTDDWYQHLHTGKGKYPNRNPFFLTAKYMAKAIVISLIKAGRDNDSNLLLVANHFELPFAEIQQMASVLNNSDSEQAKIISKITPKQSVHQPDLENLVQAGKTDRATEIKTTIESYPNLIEHIKSILKHFTETDDDSELISMVNENRPFGYDEMDSIIYEAALADIQIEELELQSVLSLLRIFGENTDFPSSGYDLNGRRWNNWGVTFSSELSRCIHGLQVQLTPKDLFAAIKNDCQISRSMIADTSWCCSILTSFLSENYDSLEFSSESSLKGFAQRAYLHIEEKVIEARLKNRWVSEEMLATAIKALFGEEFVEMHATPAWLSPQHLDIYLPKYCMAIEYMGIQHYEAVDFFGGQPAFEKTVKRDKRKKELCSKAGISLIYVTHKDEIGESALKIWDQHKNNFKNLTS